MELEIKAHCADFKKVVDRLLSMNAVFTDSFIETDYYYNHPARNFALTDEAFRIRRIRDEVRLTYKGPKVSSTVKARFEAETVIGDFDTIKAILEKLSFVESGMVEKKRSIYKLNEFEICLDDVKNAGTFVEIEKIGDDLKTIEKEILELARNLELYNFEKRSYLHIVLENSNK